MANRASSRFNPYPGQRPARGTVDDSDSQGHGGGTRNRSQLPVPQNVLYQQGSQGPIFNGPIEGGVILVSNPIDALKILYDHSATGAMHDSDERSPPPLCHPGTREAVLIRIQDWYGYQKGPEKPIMWVHAPAGYGKTAIAGTISLKMLERAESIDFVPLGATFFFWRTSPERNNPARFIITIAHQLAISIPELKPYIADAVSQNPLVLKKTLEVQLNTLIVDPFKALGDLEDIPNRLVIVDGLDECINSEQESRVEKKYAEDREKVQVRVLELIRTLQAHRLPLSFLLLSRSEIWIKHHIESNLTDLVEVVDLYAVGDHMNDVKKYVSAELSRIAANIKDVEWPTARIVTDFVGKINGHMLYASTVIRHIDDPYHDPRKRLGDFLVASTSSNLDLAHSTHFSSPYELYRQILRSCPESNRLLMIEVLEDVILTRQYFFDHFGLSNALATLDALSGRTAGSGVRAIRGLHAVLNFASNPDTDHSQVLNPFIHPSFVDFLTNPMLSSEFTVDSKKGSQRLLWKCFECMSTVTNQWEVPQFLTAEQWQVEDLSGVRTSKWCIKQEEAHIHLALVIFGPLSVMAWSKRVDVGLRPDEHIRAVKKMLTIDLTTCFKQLSGSREWQPSHLCPLVPAYLPVSPENFDWLDHLPKASDPLAQQAIMHVLSSVDEATSHLHDQSVDELGLIPYFHTLYERSTKSNMRASDQVAQALEELRGTLAIADLRGRLVGWNSFIEPILNYIRQTPDDA